MPQSPGLEVSTMSDDAGCTRNKRAMRDCSAVSVSMEAPVCLGSADRKRERKKSRVAGEVVVTEREGPAARNNGTREGGIYVRKLKVDAVM